MLLRKLIFLLIFTQLFTGYLHESIGTCIEELNIKISKAGIKPEDVLFTKHMVLVRRMPLH